MASKKLDRTLHELEDAFTDWEAISSTKPRTTISDADARKAADAERSEKEFRQKTKKLLSQLREQLAELND